MARWLGVLPKGHSIEIADRALGPRSSEAFCNHEELEAELQLREE